jgi:hypothetical protein
MGKVISEEEFSVMSFGFDELKCDNKFQAIMHILINQVVYVIYLAFQVGITIKYKNIILLLLTVTKKSFLITRSYIFVVCSGI